MLKSNIIWPKHRRYKSRTEWEPVGFFSDCLCNAYRFDLMLGFFSTSAISVLANGFATFLYNGGKMRLIINDILSEEDKAAIQKGTATDDLPYFDLTNIHQIKDTLSERDRHFFDCIAWLIRNDRIEIKIISPKSGVGISHTKAGVFYDRVNEVCFDGSCNFSRTALLENIESISVSCGWDNELENNKVQAIKEDFERIFQEEDDSVLYKNVSDIQTKITKNFTDKSLEELLRNETEIIKRQTKVSVSKSAIQALSRAKERVEAIIERLDAKQEIPTSTIKEPSFPYPSGPREYQIEAFNRWKVTQKGLFAMATGTGKTITSLNCLLQIYKRYHYYKAIILVPTITLVEQWENECKKFNFTNITKVCSKYKGWQAVIDNLKMIELSNPNNDVSYIIISTYSSFIRPGIFSDLNSLSRRNLLLIADEAHNMGSRLIAQRLDSIKYLRRIGLSATPERQFDDAGNRKIMTFFGCDEEYTFEYSMDMAIHNEPPALCKYLYYPHIVRLTVDEMCSYIELSKKIAKIANFDDEISQEKLKRYLLIRKQIIHKAVNKKDVFKEILQKHLEEYHSLKYTLVYVPEGNTPDETADIFDTRESIEDDAESLHLINEYTIIVRDLDPHITVKQFTSESKERESMLKDFAAGNLDVLTSMKCLDEGVDVPRSELAIFCASTGNPRQFIQRRGRVLRLHKDKKRAIIHDLIVIPDEGSITEDCFEIEKSLVETEIKRVRDFALLSENSNETLKTLDDVLNYYQISLFS